MQQQGARTKGVVVHDVAVAIGADMAVVQADHPLVHAGVAVPEIHPALAQRLDLRPLQDDSGLQPLLDRVVVEGLAVGRGDFLCPVFLVLGHGATIARGAPFLDSRGGLSYNRTKCRNASAAGLKRAPRRSSSSSRSTPTASSSLPIYSSKRFARATRYCSSATAAARWTPRTSPPSSWDATGASGRRWRPSHSRPIRPS